MALYGGRVHDKILYKARGTWWWKSKFLFDIQRLNTAFNHHLSTNHTYLRYLCAP